MLLLDLAGLPRSILFWCKAGVGYYLNCVVFHPLGTVGGLQEMKAKMENETCPSARAKYTRKCSLVPVQTVTTRTRRTGSKEGPCLISAENWPALRPRVWGICIHGVYEHPSAFPRVKHLPEYELKG